ncbi:hypothetical protein [Paenibacillus lautus]|uniref:hypothetical protein n=1 Tax=Paenibacillus lautus TaxID=1401 RepID=UPI003D2D5886
MRRKWPFLVLALTLAVGMSVPATNEVQASVKDQQPSQGSASEGMTLDKDGRSRLYPKNWYPGYRDEQGRFLHDFSYAGYRRGEEEIPRTKKNKRIDVTKAPYRPQRCDGGYPKSDRRRFGAWRRRSVSSKGHLSGSAAAR